LVSSLHSINSLSLHDALPSSTAGPAPSCCDAQPWSIATGSPGTSRTWPLVPKALQSSRASLRWLPCVMAPSHLPNYRSSATSLPADSRDALRGSPAADLDGLPRHQRLQCCQPDTGGQDAVDQGAAGIDARRESAYPRGLVPACQFHHPG